MRTMVWIGFWVLLVLHQDFWNWNDSTIWFGFLPVGLAWHVGFSLACSALWIVATKFAWPDDIEAWAEEPAETN
jgi:hypothetical protein